MKKYGKGRKTAVTVALVIFVAIIIWGVSRYKTFLAEIPRSDTVSIRTTEPEAVTTAVSEPSDPVLNVLVIGQSAREGEAHHMADSIVLVSVNKDRRTMTLTSFLRDTYLTFPEYTDQSGQFHGASQQRLNLCYHMGHTYGGTADAIAFLDQCLYDNFGIQVDFNVVVDFLGLEKIVDYFGGIEVELTEAEASYLNADDTYVLGEVSPGRQLLNGMAALSYARMRNAEGDNGSDIRRTARQRTVMIKLMEKISQSDVESLFWMMKDLLPYVVTDMTDGDITRCLVEVFPIVPSLQIETGTCPAQNTYWGEIVNIGGFDSLVLRYDEEENRSRMISLTEGS